MQLYKATIKLESSLITPLKGDTIWGHVVWGIANHEGDEAVSNFLHEEKSENPSFIISSAFPKGTICKPYPKHIPRGEMSTKKYADIKRNKKIKFVSASVFFKTEQLSCNEASPYKVTQVMHNGINRFSNTVEEGSLYSIQEMWANQKEFDLYILSKYDDSRIKQLLNWAFEHGYGADASTGKGKVSVEDVVKVETKLSTTTYVALAPFVTDFSIIKDGTLCADTFIRTGKIGGSFVTSMNPFKKTIVMFDEGAVFESDKPIQFIGNLLTQVHSDERICHSGFAPVIPIGD